MGEGADIEILGQHVRKMTQSGHWVTGPRGSRRAVCAELSYCLDYQSVASRQDRCSKSDAGFIRMER